MTYMGIHDKLRRHRGSASQYACVTCGGQAREWAYNHQAVEELSDAYGRYSRDLNDYQPMCAKCHRTFDWSWLTHCAQGHPYSGENVRFYSGKRRCRECIRAKNRRAWHEATPEQRARRNEQARAYRARLKARRAAEEAA